MLYYPTKDEYYMQEIKRRMNQDRECIDCIYRLGAFGQRECMIVCKSCLKKIQEVKAKILAKEASQNAQIAVS